MKKIWGIVIIALVIGGGFFVYKNYVEKEEKGTTNEGNVSANTDVSEEKENVLDEQNSTNVAVADDNNKKSDDNNKNEESNNINSNSSIENKASSNKIKESLAPSGFMGSSLLRVVLYDNGEVYLVSYNGEGYDEKDIEKKELLAVNASEIKSKGSGEDFEAIIVKGKSNLQVKNRNYGWIEFE